MLTSQSHFGYDAFVPAKSGTGSDSLIESRRTTTACESRAVFLCPQHGVLYSEYERAIRGAARLAGFLDTWSVSPSGSLTLLTEGGRELQPLSRRACHA